MTLAQKLSHSVSEWACSESMFTKVCRHVTPRLIRLRPFIVSDEKRYITRMPFFSSLINREADSFLIMHMIASFIFHVSTAIFTVRPRKQTKWLKPLN